MIKDNCPCECHQDIVISICNCSCDNDETHKTEMPINQCIKCGQRAFPAWMYNAMPYCIECYKEVSHIEEKTERDLFLETLRKL